MENLWRDIRYAARVLLKSPGFTAAAVLVTALGIGANTAIFSVFNAVLLRPLPYRDPDALVMVWGNFRRLNMTKIGASAPEFVDLKERNGVFAEVAAFQHMPFNLTGGDEPQRV